jgi:hypothetical protein
MHHLAWAIVRVTGWIVPGPRVIDNKTQLQAAFRGTLVMFRRSATTIVCALVAVVLLVAGTASAQRGSTIRERPPGQLATIERRKPDFNAVRFLGMQRNYRPELRKQLRLGYLAIRMGRRVQPMVPIVWPPEKAR